MRKLWVIATLLTVMLFSNINAQPQFEFCNNFLQNLSFITGVDEGIE